MGSVTVTDHIFHPDGTMSPPSADELADADATTVVVALVTGTDPDGRDFYAFVAVRPSRYREFHTLTTAGSRIVLSDFGAVLASGSGGEPTDEVRAEINRRYGYDVALVEKLTGEVEAERRAHGAAAEAARVMDIVQKLKSK